MTKLSLEGISDAYQMMSLDFSLNVALTIWDQSRIGTRGHKASDRFLYKEEIKELEKRVKRGESLDDVLPDYFSGPLERFLRKFLRKAGYECSLKRRPEVEP